MKTINTLAVGILVVASAVFGCGQSDASPPPASAAVEQEGARTSTHSFSFGADGVRATSRVVRRSSADGSETLQGTTEIVLPGAAHATVVRETVDLDARGRLVSAKSELRRGSAADAPARTVELDAVRGVVKIREPKGEQTREVAADHPWAYAGLFHDVAPEAAGLTATQIWVARRAAAAGERLRVVEVLAARSSLTVPEQVVFTDGDAELVVVGDEVGETDRDFVRAVPWKALEVLSTELRAATAECEPGPA